MSDSRTLAVLCREVGDTGGDAGGWGLAHECGVGSSVVVAVEEPLEIGCAFAVAPPAAAVGPFTGKGAVVALNLAVGLGSVGPGPLVFGPGQGQGGGEDQGAVAGTVVSQDAVDLRDAMAAEELDRTTPEGGGGGALLVQEFLGVGQPRVVIERGVEVDVAGAGASALGATGGFVLGRSPAVDASRHRRGCGRSS